MEYRVKALNREHAVLAQLVDAIDEADARRQLGMSGLRVISLAPVHQFRLFTRAAKIPLVIFSQELVALLDAGLSLVESIEALTEKEVNAAVRRPLEQILSRLYEGQTLGAALAEHPSTFSYLYVATVRASERTGSLREALTRFITYQQQIDALRKTLINASIYPAVLLAAGILVTLFLMGYVVPRFSSIYEQLGSDLPFASKLLLQWGQMLEAHTLTVLAIGGAAAAGAAYGLSRRTTRAALGAWIAKLPAIGRQLRLYQLARLYRTVGMLLRSGMPAVTAMSMSAGLLSETLRPAFGKATQSVREGQSIANAMEQRGAHHTGCGAHAAGGRAQRQHGRNDRTHRRVLRRRNRPLGCDRDALDRAPVHDLDRPPDRRHRRADVLSHFSIGRERPMNAVVQLPVVQPPVDQHTVAELLPLETRTAAGEEAIDSSAYAAAAVPQALDEAIIARAMAESRRTGRSPIEFLTVETGRTPVDLAQALAVALDYRFVGGEELSVLEPAFDILPPSEATRRNCAVVRSASGMLAVVSDPFDTALRSWLEARTAEVLEWAVAAGHELSNFIARRAEALRAIDAVLSQAESQGTASTGPDNLSYVSISEDASPIVRLVHSTVYDALRAGASDIHLESTANGLTVRYRIDGVLVNIASVSGMAVAEQVISRIKVMSELDIAERRVPQDGRFSIALDRRPIDFRVSVIPSIFGEDAVLRALDKQALTERLHGLRLDALGFDMRVVTQLRRLSSLPYGMLLVTGPTGSGKTTTLYAAISETQTGSDKIVTIEDPVEYQLQGVLQIPVNEKKGLTFARGLRSILRHDPDKIMVGEIRDSETAQIAIQSALTGHLVFTTVHANNVFDVVSRFTHMGVDTYSFVSALSGVLAQRLIRVVCEQCAEPHVPTRQLLEESQLSAAASAAYNFTIGRGCQHCRGSGYRGRKAIGELLVLNDELREAIINRAPVRQLKELSQKGGVRLIRSVALDLVRRGETTLEEVNRVTVMA